MFTYNFISDALIKRKLFCQFLDLVPLPDGKADTIMVAVPGIIDQKGNPRDKTFGPRTDGMAMAAVHCASHHLALVCKKTSEKCHT